MKIDPALEKRLIAVRQRLMASIKAELDAGEVTSMELLAVLAHTTGACIAMQDQRKVTPAAALELVAKNIEGGNREAMAEVLSASGPAN